MTGQPDGFGFIVADVTRMFRAELDRRVTEARLGLTPGDGRTLFHARRAGDIVQSLLAERMGVEAMTLSGSLDRLQAKGLVERLPHPDDRRAKLVRVTQAGQAMIAYLQPISGELVAEAVAGIDPAEWERTLAILSRVRDNLALTRAQAAAGKASAA